MTEDKKIKVLCVEDEKEIRENIAEILRDEGFEVFEGENGKHGFDVFLQQKPDIVISDIMMPEVDGYGLLNLIRENKNIRNNNVPFIFLTALGQKDNVIKGVGLSANDYLVKPVDFDLMIAKIREKTSNTSRIQESHKQTIKNLKNQITVILPETIFSYLDVITQTSSILRDEPYGPLPHRKYLEDLDKIRINAVRLRAAIINSLDESVIDHKLNAEEEIIPLFSLISDLISGLSDKFKTRITLEKSGESDSLIKIKMDRLILLDALRKIFTGMFKTAPEGSLNIRLMKDLLDQMVIIFHLESKSKISDFYADIPQQELGKMLDQQSCRFEIVEGKENTAILTIPSHRVIS
ncbi:MAG: response regulator [Proteobacteria bacterium]|nr:response regulator [Pseudomonadota bacterium]